MATPITSSNITTTPHWNKDPYYHQKIHYVTEGHKSSQSASQYMYQFNAFLKYLGISTGESDVAQFLKKDPQQIEESIADFLLYLNREKHLKAASINLAKSAIVYFFKRNRVKLDKDWISGYVPAEEGYEQDRAYTHEEIQKLLDACSEDRIRVAILLMASTGMRVGALTYKTKEDKASVLEFGDLTWIAEHEKYRIMVYNRSKNGRYPTYCSHECAVMINRYRDYRREECGEFITESSPIIREQFDPSDKLAVSHPRKITQSSLAKTINIALKKAGIKTTLAHKVKVKQTHGFRKFAITMMDQAGVKDTHRRYLTGHAQVGQDGSYVLPTQEALLAEYLKAEDLLTINPTPRLKKENQELKSGQAEEIAQLRVQLSEYKQFTSKIAAEINDLKASRGLDAYEYAISVGDPNFSNIVDVINESRTKNGQEPVAIITQEDKKAKAQSIRYRIRQIKNSVENRKRGIQEEQPFPETIGDKERQIGELEYELKELEGNIRIN